MKRLPLSAEQEQQIIDLYASGLSLKKVAAKTGFRTATGIKSILLANAVILRNGGFRKGHTITKKANFTEDDRRKLIRLYNDGIPIPQIMVEIGISRPRLKEILTEEGVLRRPKGFQTSNKHGCKLHSVKAKQAISTKHKANRHRPSLTASSKGGVVTGKIRWQFHKPDPVAQLLVRYKKGADDRELPFSLSHDEFRELISGECFYCGRKSSNLFNAYKFKYNGIDRADNSRGYHKDNCVTSCGRCNRMKCTMSQEEFVAHCAMITERHMTLKAPCIASSH